MRCFYVLVHGKLDWSASFTGAANQDRPAGFYCHRYVLARTELEATDKAFRRVRENLDKKCGWLSNGSAKLILNAEELAVAPVHKLLKLENRGHTFYANE
jgi:hypothetical protein